MALPSDVARAGPNVRAAYQEVLEAMVQLFEGCLEAEHGMSARQRGLAMVATCVGAMVLSRTIDDVNFADEICEAAQKLVSDAMN